MWCLHQFIIVAARSAERQQQLLWPLKLAEHLYLVGHILALSKSNLNYNYYSSEQQSCVQFSLLLCFLLFVILHWRTLQLFHHHIQYANKTGYTHSDDFLFFVQPCRKCKTTLKQQQQQQPQQQPGQSGDTVRGMLHNFIISKSIVDCPFGYGFHELGIKLTLGSNWISFIWISSIHK